MTTISASVVVAASADRTWRLVTDWAAQGRWMPATTVAVAAAATGGVGDRLTARSGFGRLAVVDPMVVEVWEPPRRCEVRHLGRVVTGRGRFLIEPLGADRCRFTWQEILDSTGSRRLLDPAAAPVSRLLLEVAVRRLARLAAAPA